MTVNLMFSEQEVFETLVEEGLTQGIATQEAYHAMVEDTIEEMRGLGELHDDQNLEGHKDTLRAMWGEYQRRIESEREV